ncbi:nuclear transport factor 2 family protein [Pseudoalteromonas galatheae]|uniref:nuclear transport factor 2 family protein n=1 Tax=Pseudoalteromonas galatheae TaxID=579562 RepID=UPI001ADE0A96|nr:nuclear transport factor 2 family protein [Pseudoalteromonas galatheae]
MDIFEKIVALEQGLHTPQMRSDIERISDYIHDEFYEDGLFSKGMTKADILAGLKHEDLSKHKIVSEDYKLVSQSRTRVTITYTSALESALGERSYYAQRHSTWCWCSDDKWRLISHSAALI